MCHCLFVPPFASCCHCRTIYCRDGTLSFPCILCWAFYIIITVHVAIPHFCSRKQWWTPFILPIRVFPFSFISPLLSADKFSLSLLLCQSRLCLLHPLSDEYPPSSPHDVSSSSCSSPIFKVCELPSHFTPHSYNSFECLLRTISNLYVCSRSCNPSLPPIVKHCHILLTIINWPPCCFRSMKIFHTL